VSAGARYARLFVGFVLIAEAIALNVRCELGLGPLFIVFEGLHEHGVPTIGTAAIIINAALLLWALALRERPGLATLGQVFLVGPMADLALLVTPRVDNVGLQATYLVVSLLVMSFGAALYLSADHGAGPYDAVMRGLYRNGRRLPLAGVRLAMELTAVLVGWLLGGPVGVGTVVIGLGIGPGIAVGLRVLRAMPDRHHPSLQSRPESVAG
jgi:uncharacterized membrane protein YczE